MDWHTNSKVWKPPAGRQCEIKTVGGEVYEAVYVKDINRFLRDINRWRRTQEGLTKKEKWIDDNKVVAWREL